MSGGGNLLSSLQATGLSNVENKFALLSLAERANYP